MRRVFYRDEAAFQAALAALRRDREMERQRDAFERELQLGKQRSDSLLDARRQERAPELIEFAI